MVEFIDIKTGCQLGNPFKAKIPEPGDTTTTEFRTEKDEFRLDLTWKVVPEESEK